MEEAVDRLVRLKEGARGRVRVAWVVAQIEVCPTTGARHLQASIGLTDCDKLTPALLRVFPRAWLRAARNWKKAQGYCSKAESRLYGPIFNGVDKADVDPWVTTKVVVSDDEIRRRRAEEKALQEEANKKA